MIKHIKVYDFDKTLIFTPEQYTGIAEWEKSTGNSWNGKGWWSSPESLNLNIFHIPVNLYVYKQYLKDMADPNIFVFIATGRIERLRRQVLAILDYNEIEYDPNHVYCNNRGSTYDFKTRLFERMIKENPKAEEFTMYDDRHEHLVNFIQWRKSQPIPINIFDVVNKKFL